MPTLRVYALARQLVRAVNQLLPRIAERSRELADQVDRSSRSVPANIAEGEHRHDGHGRQRFKTAYGSARETRAHLESAAVDIGALREELVEALADPDAYAREWMLATPDPFLRAEPVRRPAPELVPVPAGRPNARCPYCGTSYSLPFGTPLAETRCGLGGNPCLVPAGEMDAPYVPEPKRASERRCPACNATIRVTLRDGATHVRCPACRTAVAPAPR